MRFASCTIWGPDIGTQLLTNSACIRDSMSHFFTHAAPASNKTRTSTPSFWPPVGCSGPAICKLAACRIQNMHVGSTTQGASSPLMGNHFSFFFILSSLVPIFNMFPRPATPGKYGVTTCTRTRVVLGTLYTSNPNSRPLPTDRPHQGRSLLAPSRATPFVDHQNSELQLCRTK